MLPIILKSISEPCLFWLDAHYSAGITAKGEEETPIQQELEIISKHSCKNHIILIDDARLFNGTKSYPDIKELKEKVRKLFKEPAIKIENDIIQIFCSYRI
jgi:hypothetical protein